MLKQFVAGVAGILFSVASFADVIVQAPEQLIVVAINDQEVKSGIFGGRSDSYKLDAGQYNIAVKYQELFEENYINHDIVRSNIITLNTGVLQDGQTYQLALVNPPKNHEDAKKFAQRPVIALKDARGNIVAQQEGTSAKAKPWFGSSLFGTDKTIDLRENQPAPTIIMQEKNTPVEVSSPVQTKVTMPVASVAAAQAKDQQLIELWKTATPQERQKFTAWLAEQASK